MAKTLTLSGADFKSQYKTNSAHIRELIQNKSSVMDLEFVVWPGQSVPQEGMEIVFKDGARFLFAGYVSRVHVKEVGDGRFFVYGVEASDYSYIFNNKVARKTYENETLHDIVEDLMDTYVDDAYGFDLSGVATGPTIDSITFDHVSIRKCFEKLQKLTGYIWFVDYEKQLVFKAPDATAAPEAIGEATGNFESISVVNDTSQVRNSVIVIGRDDGEQDSNTVTETFEGDGETRSWELDAKPSQVVSISLNGSPQQFSLDVNERDTDEFVYSFSGQYIRITDSQSTPVGGGTPDEIVIVYYPRIPIIAKEIEPTSIATFAARDGGDGAYEYTIKDSSVSSKEEATARARQELADFAFPLVNGQFRTRTSLLEGGSVFAPGQLLTVSLPSHGIPDASGFLIQEVNITMTEDEDAGTTEYVYDVRFGGKQVGVQEFLESLAAEEGEVTNADVVLTIESTSDSFVADDDAPSHTILTPPFQYGPSGSPVGKWNMAEWN